MIIKYKIKRQYGRERKFFVNQRNEDCFLALTGRKTITNQDMLNLKKLTGVDFEEENQQNN